MNFSVGSSWKEPAPDDDDDDDDEPRGRVRHYFTFDRHPEAFEPVGGVFAWRKLMAAVNGSPPFA